MAINFPNSPQLNDTYQIEGNTWIWNGQVWEVLPVSSPTFNNVTVTGIIDGQVDDISNHNLRDLGNVVDSIPADGALLVYNATTQSWSGQVISGGFNGGTITGTLFVNNNTVSTNSTSGALRVLGGAGIGGAVFLGSTLTSAGAITIQGTNGIRLADTDSSNYVGFRAPGSVNANLVWTLPSSDGTSGQFLRTNGSGILSWATAEGGGGGGGGVIGGSDTQVQFNNNGLFDGDAGLTFDPLSSRLTASKLTVSDITNSTSSTTGATVIAGGLGVGSSVNIGGSLTVTGNINVSTTPTASAHATNKSYVDSKALAFSMAFGV